MIEETPSLDKLTSDLWEDEANLESYLIDVCDRIAEIDPELKAFLPEADRKDRLLSDARSLRDQYDTPPVLYGIPVGLKDIIHADGFTTRAGSALPPELFAGPEAAVVSTLRDNGALILGKTVTTEFAGGSPGQTRNPHDLEHTPGGSSSGSAAAVAAGISPLALGTQTGGSLIRPAAFCGIVGFKPSFDRIPTEGVIPRSKSVDHVGLYTQDVSSMRYAAPTLCPDWTEVDDVEQPTLGIPGDPYLENATDAALDHFDGVVDHLLAAGYEIVKSQIFKNVEEIERWHRYVTQSELALVHNEWFEEYSSMYRLSTAERIKEGQNRTIEELSTGRNRRLTVRERVHRSMDENDIDLWICPAATGPAPQGIGSTGDPALNKQWTYSGLPAVTIPSGTIDGLPVGLQCVTRFGSDERLLFWAGRISSAVSP